MNLSLSNLGLSAEMVAPKIVELSKKNRELTALLESERTKNKQLAKGYQDLETKLEYAKQSKSKKDIEEDIYDKDGDEDEENEQDDVKIEKRKSLNKENKELKEKLSQTSHKMMEYRSQCEILKQDLKKAQKVYLNFLHSNLNYS